VGIIFTGLPLRHEIRMRRRDEEVAAASQARLIVVAREFMELKEGRRYYSVWNHSQGPVYNVRLRLGQSQGWFLETAGSESVDTDVLRAGESLGGSVRAAA
jgi:hypothetical protein